MKYAHILSAFAAEPWAMQLEKLEAITAFLKFKADGGMVAPEEVAKITNKRANEVARAEGAVAVIPVMGVLAQRMDMVTEMSGGTSYSGLTNALRSAVDNEDIKAIVLDIDSPGGAVAGAQEMASEILALRGSEKPIIAQVNALAASAAYWIASAADEVVSTPSGRAGSIGVYTTHEDMSAFFEKEGVKTTYISAGRYKVEGNENGPLSDEARAYVQKLVDESYANFVGSVAKGRNVSKSMVLDRFGQGRVFGAEEALDRGMIDRIATLDETLARYGAEVEPERVRRVKAANAARAADANNLVEKLRAGAAFSGRELERGLRGLAGLSKSEAERAVALCFEKSGEVSGKVADEAARNAAMKLAEDLRSFKLPQF